MNETFFLTGATGLIGSRTLANLLHEHPAGRAYVLVRDLARWRTIVERERISAGRVIPLVGDVRRAGLGLDAGTRARLAGEVSSVLHLAADITFSRALAEARATNVRGTSNLLDVSDAWAGAERFTFVSTAFVAGRRTGFISEDDAGGEQGWVNAYEQSKWEAEQLVRNGRPAARILRSSTVVCNSVRGEVSQINAVHRALRLYHAGLAPMMPGREDAPVDLIPADWVSGAVARLALDPAAAGQTLHLCAGGGAISLGELLDRTYGAWARDAGWRRRRIERPALADLATYRLFEESVEETGDVRLRQVMRSLTHFVPQLALPKRFGTERADALLGCSAPPVRDYWPNVVEHLLAARWTSALRRAA